MCAMWNFMDLRPATADNLSSRRMTRFAEAGFNCSTLHISFPVVDQVYSVNSPGTFLNGNRSAASM